MSMFKDVIELVNITYVKNEDEEQIEQETKREVFANVKSVYQNEFFKASTSGLKPSKLFSIRLSEYDNEEVILHESKRYSIYRTYERGELIDLYTEVKANGN